MNLEKQQHFAHFVSVMAKQVQHLDRYMTKFRTDLIL